MGCLRAPTGVFTLKVLDGTSGTTALAGATISPAGGKFTYTSDAGGAVTLSPASATVTLPAGYGQNDVVGDGDKTFRLLLEASTTAGEIPTSGAPLGDSTTTITIRDNTDDAAKLRVFVADATTRAQLTSITSIAGRPAGTQVRLGFQLVDDTGKQLQFQRRPCGRPAERLGPRPRCRHLRQLGFVDAADATELGIENDGHRQ